MRVNPCELALPVLAQRSSERDGDALPNFVQPDRVPAHSRVLERGASCRVKGSETASAPGDESEAVSESDSQWRRRFEAPESGGERGGSGGERMIEAKGVEL